MIKIKNMFKVEPASKASDFAILVARIGIAALMLTHGLPKLLILFSGEPVQFPSVLGMSAGFSLVLAVFAEVLCSLFLLIGLGTRLAAVPLAITMLVAAFLIHGSDPFSVKEPSLQFLLVYVVLFLTGSGKYSADYLMQGKTVASHTNQKMKRAVATA